MKHNRSVSAETVSDRLPRARRLHQYAFALAMLAGCAEGYIGGGEDPDSIQGSASEQDEQQSDDGDESIILVPDAAPPSVKVRDAGTSSTPSVQADAGAPVSEPSEDEGDDAKDLPSAPVSEDDVPSSEQPTPSAPAPAPTAPAGGPAGVYKVKDGKIFDGCGEELVMRGVNHPTIYTDRSGEAMPEIGRTGANTVRLFWFGRHGISINELEPAILKAVANGMVPMIEFHDSTCAWDVQPIINEWLKPEVVALIKKHEKHLIVNIANEASYPNGDEFVKTYKDAVARMRSAGIKTPLVIDGGRCGRDYDTLLNRGKELLDADPDHNLIFSAHLYDPLPASTYASMFARARSMQLPFIVGEFANKEPPGCGKAIDYASLISEANKAGIGWLAWSWGDNDANTAWNADCNEFDMTKTFAFDSLQGWGKEISTEHGASIQKTASRPYALTHGDTCK